MQFDKTKIAELTRRVRQKHDLTQKEFGKLLGVTGCTVSLYESGRRLPKMEVFLYLLEQDESIIFYETKCPTCKGKGTITSTKVIQHQTVV